MSKVPNESSRYIGKLVKIGIELKADPDPLERAWSKAIHKVAAEWSDLQAVETTSIESDEPFIVERKDDL